MTSQAIIVTHIHEETVEEKRKRDRIIQSIVIAVVCFIYGEYLYQIKILDSQESNEVYPMRDVPILSRDHHYKQ